MEILAGQLNKQVCKCSAYKEDDYWRWKCEGTGRNYEAIWVLRMDTNLKGIMLSEISPTEKDKYPWPHSYMESNTQNQQNKTKIHRSLR